ncbi:unnamed protein product [Camellia sinensis]
MRLAGAAADVHCYDLLTNKWPRLHPLENLSLQGQHMWQLLWAGIGPAGLSAEDLHVLDLTQQRPRWHRVVVQGPGPGPHYGHVMALVGQRYLMEIGGNDESVLWLMYGPWTQLPSHMNGRNWNQKRKQTHVLMAFFCFVEGGMLIVCHWPVHMDLQNIEMVCGNGQLLLVSHHLLDINMQRFL